MLKENVALLLSLNESFATIRPMEDIMTPVFDKIYSSFKSSAGGICFFESEQNAVLFFAETGSQLKTADKKTAARKWVRRFPLSNLPLALNIKSNKIVHHSYNTIIASLKDRDDLSYYLDIIKKEKITELVQVPLRSGGQLIGFLLFAHSGSKHFEGKEKLEFLLQLANVLGVGIKNFLSLDELRKREQFQEVLLRITNNLVSIKDRDEFFIHLTREFTNRDMIENLSNYAELHLTNFFSGEPVKVRFRSNQQFEYIYKSDGTDLFSILHNSGYLKSNESVLITNNQLKSLCEQNLSLEHLCKTYDIYEIIFSRFTTKDGCIIERVLGLLQRNVHQKLDNLFSDQMDAQLAVLLKNFAAYEQIDSLKKQLEQEKDSLIGEISSHDIYQDIIGSSPVIQGALYKVKQVAALDSTVLILGETVTGKELIAKAIHNTSSRKDRLMIKVNCATLPAQLIESELFGHEKGSFTGAVEKRIGKFEMAHTGTIFLDEIGEMPLELQAKLLRVLQEKEFERIGGKQTIKTDVRVIAATNRNLEDEVNAGRFRADLYYRLNVFPITVPPLRSRKEDIPLFVRHFSEKFAKAMGKTPKHLNRSDLESFYNYEWPGNIRELEHLIERATITSSGSTFDFSDFKFLKHQLKEESTATFKTLEAMEKEYIISALKAAGGKIMGKNSAAELLGINGKTLGSRMRKLGIKREIVIN